MSDHDNLARPNLRLVTSGQVPTGKPNDPNSLNPVLYCQFNGEGPAAVDFMAEDDPRIVGTGKILDQVTDGVYVVFTKRRLGELASVQVLEADMGRHPAWLDIMTTITGPTIGNSIRKAYEDKVIVEKRSLLSPTPQEVRELQEAWEILHKASAQRQELNVPSELDRSPEAEPWQVCDSTLGVVDLDYAAESETPSLTEYDYKLPAGFLARAGLASSLKSVYIPTENKIVFSAKPSSSGPSQNISLQMVDPYWSEPVSFAETKNGFTVEVPAIRRHREGLYALRFGTILMKLGEPL